MSESPLQHHLDEGCIYHVGPRNRGWRLDDFLSERIPRLSHERIYEMIRTRVTLSWGETPTPETIVSVGGDITVGFQKTDETELDLAVPILFEDEDLLAVDKPSGILVHPTSYCRKNALTRILERQRQARLYMVHRLDRDTSGVFLLTKTKSAAQKLSFEFQKRSVDKEYSALVWGHVNWEQTTIEKNLGRMFFTPNGIRRNIAAPADSGESAITECRLEEKFTDRSLLRLIPKTGRTHQLRIHLCSIGHPIVGDKLYGNENPLQTPLRLHARTLSFSHPQSGTRTSIESKLPIHFLDITQSQDLKIPASNL